MTRLPGDEDFLREHQIFWLLVKGSRDHPVGRVYLAVQAALAFGSERVDVGWLMGAMMAQGRRSMDPSCESLGANGLAYFHWLFEVELSQAGAVDVHEYRLRRRHDGKQIVATVRTQSDPGSLHYRQDFERQKRILEKKRAAFLATYRAQPPR